jgi:acetyl-CoA synthase
MPRELKEILADKLKKRAEELGAPELFSKIADETTAANLEGLIGFLQKVRHPALDMPPLL